MSTLRMLLIALLLTGSQVIMAADATDTRIEPPDEDSQASPDKPESVPAPAAASDKESNKDKPSGKAETFTPSEEISEDFAVSFPVDI